MTTLSIFNPAQEMWIKNGLTGYRLIKKTNGAAKLTEVMMK